MNENVDDLTNKVEHWLSTEGYSLEFAAANIMGKIGYRVWQGLYARNEDNTPREVDLVATVTKSNKEKLLRVYNVIECKYSKDKPWVIFSGNRQRINHSALVAQSITSKLGESIMWSIAGDENITSLEMFNCPERFGFGGRQALGKGNRDLFYNSIKSVVQNSFSLVKQYDNRDHAEGEVPKYGAVAFPVLLIDGKLFSAYFDEGINETKIEEVRHARCHWRGSSETNLHTTVDLVTLDYFEEFSSKRFEEVCSLLEYMEKTLNQILDVKKEKSMNPLNVKDGARGVVGLPTLLKEIICKDD